jgi:hypothetical protein
MNNAYKDWNFPLNNDGEEDGENDTGIETFNKNPIISLAREICQNSLDAEDKDAKAPVTVHFEKVSLSKADFPNLESFLKVLEACKAYSSSPKAQKLFSNAIKIMNSEEIPCLKISDFNTTGLKGISEKNSDWYKLTKRKGDSGKADGKLGSFGIGKFAPFAASDTRTVFYNTKNQDGQYGFQGIARLISHELDGNIKRGVGYYGVSERNAPITEKISIPNFIKRENTGTDIFIIGFTELENWETDIISAIVSNFYYAIANENLVVKAGNQNITHINLPGVIEGIKKSNLNTNVHHYYEAITSIDSQEFIHENFMDMGKISLKVILGKDYPKKVAMVRGAGMTIFDKSQFDTTLRFAGVFYAADEKINNYLKTLEPPEHDKFSTNKTEFTIEEKKRAKLVLKNLYDWIKESIYSIADKQASEESDIEGVSKFLPDDVDDFSTKSDTDDIDEEEEAATEIKIIERKDSRPTGKIKLPTQPALPDDIDDIEFVPGTDSNEGDDGKAKTDDGKGGSSGDGNSTRPGDKNQDVKSNSPIGIKYERLFCSDSKSGLYVLSFTPVETCSGTLTFTAIGEVGQEPMEISSAKLVADNTALPITSDGSVGPFAIFENQKNTIEVKLKKSGRFSLGVSLYGN